MTESEHFHALSSCFEPYGVVKFGSLFRVLLMMLLTIEAASGPIIMGMDDTIERRKGQKIKRLRHLSRQACVQATVTLLKSVVYVGFCLMLLVEIPWAQRVWALPFLTALAPSERLNQQQKRRHKTLLDWVRGK